MSMNKPLKRILALILVVCMMVSNFVFADTVVEVKDIAAGVTYSYNYVTKKLYIRTTYGTWIEDGNVTWRVNLSSDLDHFKDLSQAVSVVIGEGIVGVDDYGLQALSEMTTLSLPSTLNSISEKAFRSNEVDWTTHDISKANDAFSFIGTTKLSQIKINSSNAKYSTPNNISLVDKTTNTIIRVAPNVNGQYNLPGVYNIGPGALAGSKFTSVNFYNYSINIDDGAFWSMPNIATISNVNGIKKLGNYVFRNSTKLVNVSGTTSFGNLTSIGINPFYGTSLAYGSSSSNSSLAFDNTGIFNTNRTVLYAVFPNHDGEYVVPSTVSEIKDYAFFGSNRSKVTINNTGNVNLGIGTFKNMPNLTSVDALGAIPTIPESAFSFCSNLESLNIVSSNSAETIGDYAFYNDSKFKTFDFSKYNIKNINQYAFYNNALTEVRLPNTTRQIFQYAFKENSNLTSMVLNNGLQKIYYEAFEQTPIKSLALPSSILSGGLMESAGAVFGINMPELETITSNSPNYKVINGALYSVENGKYKNLVKYPAKHAVDVYEIDSSTEIIGIGAFSGAAKVNELVFGTNLKNIQSSAFKNAAGIAKIDISKTSMTTIGDNTFEGCSGLETFIFNDDIETIGVRAFANNTSLKSVDLKNTNISTIKESAFDGNSAIEGIYLPANNISIATKAFYGLDKGTLKDFYIPEGTTLASQSIFIIGQVGDNHVATPISIHKNVTLLADSISGVNKDFYQLYFPNDASYKDVLTSNNYQYGIFSNLQGEISSYNGNITYMYLPKIFNGYNIEKIGENTFYNSSIKEVYLPNTVNELKASSFEKSYSLEKINLTETNLTTLGDKVFSECRALKDVVIPIGVTEIPASAFWGDNSLSTVSLPHTLTTIKESAFLGTTNLKYVVIPRGVTILEQSATSANTTLNFISENIDGVNIANGNSSKRITSWNPYNALKQSRADTGTNEIKWDVTYSEAEWGYLPTLKEHRFLAGEKSLNDLRTADLYESQEDLKMLPENVYTLYSQDIGGNETVTTVWGNYDIIKELTYKDEGFSEINGYLIPRDDGKYVLTYETGPYDFPIVDISTNVLISKKSMAEKALKESDFEFMPIDESEIGTHTYVSPTRLGYYQAALKDAAGNVFFVEYDNTHLNLDDEAPAVVITSHNATVVTDDNGVEWHKATSTGYLALFISDAKTGIKPSGDFVFTFEGVDVDAGDIKENKEGDIVKSINVSVSTMGENGTLDIKNIKDYAGNELPVDNKIDFYDNIAPKIVSITQKTESDSNNDHPTNEKIIVTVEAVDQYKNYLNETVEGGVGLADEAYSFDGGTTWQEDNFIVVSSNATLNVVVRDKLENLSSKPVDVENIDTTSPTVDVSLTPDSFTNQDVTLTVIASDDGYGLAENAYSYDNGQNWTNTNSVVYSTNPGTVRIVVRDKAGNTTRKEIVVDYIDKQAPTLNIYQEFGQSMWVKENYITMIISDNLSGVAENGYSIDGGITWGPFSAKVTDNKTYDILVKDRAGNEVSSTYTISNIDKIAPEVTLSKNIDSLTALPVIIIVNANDSQSGLKENAYSIDEGKTWQKSNEFTVFTNDTYTIWTTDSADNITVKQIVVDNIYHEKPTIMNVSLSTPNGLYEKDSTTLTIIADSSHGMLDYSIDGGQTYQPSNKFVITKNGDYSIVARDNTYNTDSTTFTVNVFDNEAPDFEYFVSNKDGSGFVITNGHVMLSISASDKLSGLHSSPYSFDNGITWTADKTYEVEENTTIKVCVRDAVTNISCKDLEISNIDVDGPVIDKLELSTTEPTNESITLTITAHDEYSDLHEFAYALNSTQNWQKDKTFKIEKNGTYMAYVRDVVGNISSKEIEVDNIYNYGPQIIKVEASAESWVKDDVTLTVSATSTCGIDSYSFDGGQSYQSDNFKTFSNNQAVKIIVKDIVGNTSSYTYQINVIDKEIPVVNVSISNINGSDIIQTNEFVKVTVNAIDIQSGLDVSGAYSFNDGPWTTSHEFVVSSNGDVNIKVRDSVGNIYNDIVAVSGIDTTAPEITSSEFNTDDWTNQDVILTVGATDDSGIAKNGYSFDGGASWQQSSSYTIKKNQKVVVMVKDMAGNIATREVEVRHIDKDMPSLLSIDIIAIETPVEILELPEKSENITESVLPDEVENLPEVIDPTEDAPVDQDDTNDATNEVVPPTDIVLPDDDSTSAEGTKVPDEELAPEISNSEESLVDELSIGTYADPVNGQVKVIFNVEDVGSGLADEAYSFDGGSTWQADNYVIVDSNQTVTVWVRDKVGNISIFSSDINNIDKNPPEISLIVSNPTDYTSDEVLITVEATDEDLHPQAYSFDNGGTWQASNTYSVMENGTYQIVVRDTAGNVTNREITIDNIDNLPPSILNIILFDDNGDITDADYITALDVNIQVEAEDLDSGLASMAYRFNNGDWTESKIFTVSENGPVKIDIIDNVGNIATEYINIQNIYKNDISLGITNVYRIPANYTTENVEFVVDIDTDLSHDNYFYSFDGGVNWQSSNKFTATEENQLLQIVVKDKALNSSSIYDVYADNIDRVAPSMEVFVDKITNDETYYTGEPIKLRIVSEDDKSGLHELAYGLKLNNEIQWQADNIFVVEANGTYDIYVRDKLGNVANKSIDIDSIDNEAPVLISVDFDHDLDVVTNESIVATLTANDNFDTNLLKYRVNSNEWQTSPLFEIEDNGTYVFEAMDSVGHISNKKTFEITNIDKEAPVINEIKMTHLTDDMVLVSILAIDNCETVSYSLDGITYDSVNKFELPIANAFTIYVKDNAGNITQKDFYTIYIEGTIEDDNDDINADFGDVSDLVDVEDDVQIPDVSRVVIVLGVDEEVEVNDDIKSSKQLIEEYFQEVKWNAGLGEPFTITLTKNVYDINGELVKEEPLDSVKKPISIKLAVPKTLTSYSNFQLFKATTENATPMETFYNSEEKLLTFDVKDSGEYFIAYSKPSSGGGGGSGGESSYPDVSGGGFAYITITDKTKGYIPYTVSNGKTILAPISSVIGNRIYFVAPVAGKYKLMENIVAYNDIAEHWAKDSIKFMANRNAFKDIADDSFDPNVPITRAELVNVLMKLKYFDTSEYEETLFTDIKHFVSDIEYARINGIVQGVGNNLFTPNNSITREQLATIFTRYVENIGIPLAVKKDMLYNDESNISDWAFNDVKKLSAWDIVEGDENGNFNPKAEATRGEVAQMMKRLIERIILTFKDNAHK